MDFVEVATTFWNVVHSTSMCAEEHQIELCDHVKHEDPEKNVIEKTNDGPRIRNQVQIQQSDQNHNENQHEDHQFANHRCREEATNERDVLRESTLYSSLFSEHICVPGAHFGVHFNAIGGIEIASSFWVL